MLLMNGLVMYDHQTDSLWSQVTGTAISGELSGTRLQHLAAPLTTWRAWASEHPETLVLDKLGRTDYSFDPYDRYYTDASAGLFGPSRGDERLGAKDFVVGLVMDDVARAYPFSKLVETPVVNDIIGQRSVVVVFDVDTSTAVVLEGMAGEQRLTFEPMDSDIAGMSIRDRETGTTWSALTGKATEGPLKGSTLRQVPSTTLFWFAWADFHPETEVYADPGGQ